MRRRMVTVPRARPKPMDVLWVDGAWHFVIDITDGAVTRTEPCGTWEAAHRMVITPAGPERLIDLLEREGWTPPAQ